MDPKAASLKAAEDVVNMKAVLKDSWYAPKCDIVLFLCVCLTMALPFVVSGSNTVLVRSQTGFFHKPSRTEIFTRTRELSVSLIHSSPLSDVFLSLLNSTETAGFCRSPIGTRKLPSTRLSRCCSPLLKMQTLQSQDVILS